MAKTTTTLAGEEQAAPELALERLKFRDMVYTSRTLIIPETDRALPVSKGLVEVLVSDTDAVKFLKANAEFEPAKE
ncbi:hypothetical protein [Pseudomonas sp. BF-R-12]|uniref:hypothetical protein n=1 Tax=Pseudomonas sp. BF-R-12 TaxID=2832363 RepID=UPI001CBDEB3A|nr:hypothetical protein [Pseudomonas sp. BF-R-12]